MLSRQEASPAVTNSAPVDSTATTLSATIAAEVSAFLTLKVPPKPQHSSAPGRSTRSMPSTARSSFSGRSPTWRTRRLWHVEWYVTRWGK